ncbi:putative glycolipid-binding domain-containing protein [Jeotgalibacillus sp. ET6]|uniref:putative glycolipid-binding domain-containing protein n=1 Tax=Jeotgalibacillus sp. ET6 TaxID=3037260 RepID=UPI00241815DD|nr:putative glycolipid-binding domain-containing protein [Jeotgalibacillus sp. ET6]MDG5471251.1 putative glycolipid-binding domain-containing protein [Jeotgalibacillus sp. ET6]
MKKIIWKNLETIGRREEAFLTKKDKGITVTSSVAGSEYSYPVTYHLQLDLKWAVQKAEITHGDKTLTLSSNGEGRWSKNGDHLEEAEGVVDIDISATPFSNTLPINRFSWETGQSRKLDVLYIDVPALTCQKVEQVYTFTGEVGEYRTFLYQCRDYETTIKVDKDGLVVDYPEAFQRL